MILSIESSCDDSAISITEIATKKLLFHKKISQELEHSVYGGVVPELAARLHAEALPKILEECEVYFKDLKAVAVTSTPGLAVTLVEGVTMAKAISVALGIPLIGVNHLIGHIYSLFIEKEAEFPLTVLLVSGGHTQVMEVKSLQQIDTVAKSMDDSFGESFDKVAKMMGLGYPGGPLIEKLAKDGDRKKHNFTIPLSQSPLIAFSYSGLKNAVRLAIEKAQSKDEYKDIAASFEHIASAHLIQKLKKYFKDVPPKRFAIVGGASANLYLRGQIEELLKPYGASLLLSELKYCSDNAAMIGRVAVEMYEKKMFSTLDELDISPKSKL
ncbi:MAG: tRNA (adenosine(37)-N6)-threonylcarbamoyltransferase complex transferase subunit TsaD [Sulfurimonas sp.]|uniref:tRNA (adenosine(37)-N6)-threonylcarbamoyltransferase complex transferase subunit TsaD n=1 Tax=Sulfurimonas sp. TaxID=2022749 RepID=UPI002629AC70|nr:tRNA (adenosine(37)-N6)-threonylcarbamoyltransferase complex transferase subunit TsaD [Sulfurimonas sp.]MCW8894611.1 tRNA (adenosine(37)-N6)-threonylcarbamoyltransferase complex transferase subunit TsaD [Sulfurimonas sp.]MCW8955054.1 tRNA (adenosine(37)-N6)-threonylcarbamoyltransferase complex transferase subunit TsaD [Sulfurimonas sp.]MCW9067439.1 tRNA (adenosine(37)-N6)-threonylcarbamoyltransferase complex transferase subunit TsaD [Sulfurimonas sp.]